MDEVSFRSRIDGWLIAVIVVAVGFTMVQGLWLWDEQRQAAVICLVVTALVGGLIIALGVPCRYTLERDHLHIRSGFMQQRIAYRDIKSVELSRNPLSAPALSLHRVKVSYRGWFQLVSPIDRERFIELLEERVESARATAGSR